MRPPVMSAVVNDAERLARALFRKPAEACGPAADQRPEPHASADRGGSQGECQRGAGSRD